MRVLRVGAIATLSRNFQLAFLRPVLGRADVEVILVSGSGTELMEGLTGLNLDVVLTNQPPPHDTASDVVVQGLDEQPVGLIGLPTHEPVAGGLRAHLERLPLVLPARSSALRMAFEALVTKCGAEPRIAAEVDDMAMMRLLAREGVGLAVIPPIVVQDELESGRLVELVRLPGIVERFYAVTTRRRFPNPVLASLGVGPR
jgi:LysR family transcriptional activator of nhaA